MGDLLIWLTLEVIFGYLFYITGVAVLKIVTFGRSKVEVHTFTSYREMRKAKQRTSWQAYFAGLLFYVVLLSLFVTYYTIFT